MDALFKNRGYGAQQRHIIDEGSKVGEARRAAQTLAGFDFDEQTAGRVAIVVTELANNLIRHAGGGELLIQLLGVEDAPLLEILSIDRGPGMTDISRCMTDGYSTGGTAGTGMGAIKRLASEFDICSAPGEGTIVMTRFGKPPALRYGAINIAMPGEIDCGDAWRIVDEPDGTAVMMIDGLGHGTFAAAAAQAGLEAFMAAPLSQPQDILTRASAAMSKTRGGAGACARIARDGRMSYSGIGNIAGVVFTPEKTQGLASHNGTLGLPLRRVQQLEYTRPAGSLLIMHSDGLSARWSFKGRRDLLDLHPAIVAALLYRDYGRNTDDSTVVVLA